MGESVYILCALAALACTILLARGYARMRSRLLLWSAVCFGCLTLNNVLIAFDLLLFPEIDLFPLRNFVSLLGVSFLLVGLIRESR